VRRPRKSWLLAECWVTKVTLLVAQSALLESGAIGVETDDGEMPDGSKKYGENILIKAYFEESPGLEVSIQNALDRFLTECEMPTIEASFCVMPEEDWQGNFVRSCTTFVVEPDIYIVPSFEIENFDKTDRLFIEMDPENAFGTGQHQTTKLCLTSIYDLMKKRSQSKLETHALDVGTGSGILAILLKKLGASSVLATETDEDALITARKNAQKNEVELETLVVSEEYVYDERCFDLVVANILAPVLIAMAENLANALKPAGEIILSGVLLVQAESVKNAFLEQGLTFVKQTQMDDWCAIIFSK
jgi:ribosomal protein L11 methyltransferase